MLSKCYCVVCLRMVFIEYVLIVSVGQTLWMLFVCLGSMLLTVVLVLVVAV